MVSDTRERILDTAARLFTEQGYEATSLREIADELAFTKAALYYHFRAKEDILMAIIQPVQDLISELIDRLEQADDLASWADALDWVIVQVLDNTSTFRLLDRNRTAIETFATREDFFREHQQMHERVNEAVRHAGKTLEEQVRMVAALGAVTGFDDWAPSLLVETEPHLLRDGLTRVVHDILGTSTRRRAKARTAR
jgi:AcrR family transcriptional regulator